MKRSFCVPLIIGLLSIAACASSRNERPIPPPPSRMEYEIVQSQRQITAGLERMTYESRAMTDSTQKTQVQTQASLDVIMRRQNRLDCLIQGVQIQIRCAVAERGKAADLASDMAMLQCLQSRGYREPAQCN